MLLIKPLLSQAVRFVAPGDVLCIPVPTYTRRPDPLTALTAADTCPGLGQAAMTPPHALPELVYLVVAQVKPEGASHALAVDCATTHIVLQVCCTYYFTLAV